VISTSGVELSRQSGKLLHRLVPEVRRVAYLVRDMAETAQEEAADVDEVARVMADVEEVAQKSAAAAEELARTAAKSDRAEHIVFDESGSELHRTTYTD